ncbi:PilN domain-containing protein [Oceanimonas smirnovii]|uniref:PilN domain-containing protein n=1 Tax=Oceanimonas smirnovii TaxID=264574 RepID=A0ABW7NZQ0_9GAMM
MSRINLLPWRQARVTRQRKRFMLQLALASALTLLAMALLNVRLTQEITRQQARNHYLQTEINQLDQALGEISTIRQQREQLLERVRLIDELQQQRAFSVHLFNQMPELVPPGVYLNSLKVSSEHLELAGKTKAYPRVAAMLRRMEASRWLTRPRLSAIYAAGDGDIPLSQFSMNVMVTPQGEQP